MKPYISFTNHYNKPFKNIFKKIGHVVIVPSVDIWWAFLSACHVSSVYISLSWIFFEIEIGVKDIKIKEKK